MRKNDPVRAFTGAFYENNRLRFLVSAALGTVTQLGILFVSWVLGAVVDAITAGDREALMRVLATAAAFLVLMLAMDLAENRVRAEFLRRASARYKDAAFAAVSGKSVSAFTRESTARYIAVLTADAQRVSEEYLTVLLWLIPQPFLLAGTLWMMLRESPLLTLVTALLGLLSLGGSVALSPELARRERAVSDENERFVGKIKDLLSGFDLIKSFKAEEEAGRVFSAGNAALEGVIFRRRWWSGVLGSVATVLGIGAQLGIFFTGAYLALFRGSVSAGTVLIFVNLSGCLLSPIQTVPQNLARLRAARGLIGKLARVAEENVSRPGAPVEARLTDAIRLDNVTFGYEPGRPVLRGVTMELRAGGMYALVGPSGSGKSTVLSLLMGADPGYGGSITLDGRELRDIDPDSLYDLESLIGQNVFIFDDTLRRNVTMFRDIPEDEVNGALRRAGLSELLETRGTDFACGENGSGLSGGERQRVSIARCLLRGTPVLLLDEATAALDNATARDVTGSVLDLAGLTRLVVTHRLDAGVLERFDCIFVLRDGQIAESGAFRDLMARRGYFYSLYTVSGG